MTTTQQNSSPFLSRAGRRWGLLALLAGLAILLVLVPGYGQLDSVSGNPDCNPSPCHKPRLRSQGYITPTEVAATQIKLYGIAAVARDARRGTC